MTPRIQGAVVASVVLLALAGSVRPARAEPGAVGAQPQMSGTMAESAFEAMHGIRITQIAVTAGGGLVDVRFTVVDPAKARPLLAGHGQLPRLVVEGSAVELQAPRHGAMRNVRLQKDTASFLLFPNARSAVHRGSRVAVAFGDVMVEPVVVQ
jgi:hypothetical protein